MKTIIDMELHRTLHETIGKSLEADHLVVSDMASETTVMADTYDRGRRPWGGHVDWVVIDDTGENVTTGKAYDFDFDRFHTPIV